MEEKQEFEIHIIPSFEKFYSDKNSYGIYSASLDENTPNREDFLIDKDMDILVNNINVVGNMPMLEIGKLYIANVLEVKHPKYGKQYQVKTIYKKPFTTRDEQLVFIKTVLTDFQATALADAYPNDNLIDLIKEDKIDLDLLKGIGEVKFNQIKEKIRENEKYQLAVIELSGQFGLPFNVIKNLSDKYGSPDLLLQKINENPYILTEVDGYGFKKVDEIALKMDVDKKSKHRVNSCIIYILNEEANNNGHVWIKKNKVVSEAIKLTNLRISDIQEVIEESIKDEKNKYMVDEDDKIFLNKYFIQEVLISENIRRLLSAKSEYSIPNIEEAIKEIEASQGFDFTDEQKEAIYLAIEKSVLVVSGKAGAGKTSVIKGIVGVLNKVDGLEYTTCALSGKASQRIQESTGLESATIHRTLGYNPNIGWTYNEHNKLGKDVIILDEASMVNSTLFLYLIRAIKDGAKLIITGDSGQLSPIGVGNVFYDLLRSDIIPKVELTKVHRQAQKSGILSNANAVRDGIDFTKGLPNNFQRLGELKDLYFYPKNDSDEVFDKIIEISKKYSGDILDFQVIVPMKNRGKVSTTNLNNELQKIFNKNPEDVDDEKQIKRKDFSLLENDKVIMRKNDYDREVFNGTIGIIEYIDSRGEGEIVIDFEGVGRVRFKKDDTKNIELAYALTAHSTQGSQWEFVVFAMTYSDFILLDKQIAYTAMTRASKALMFIVEVRALRHAIKTDNSSKRNTLLRSFLN